jgi:hypothetical protein
VVKQCVGTDGVEGDYIKTEILPEFFRNFWVRRMALDRRNYRQLVETTVEIANKVRAPWASRTSRTILSRPIPLICTDQTCCQIVFVNTVSNRS